MQNISQVLDPDKTKTVVLVTNQFQCERLIKAGRSFADVSHTELLVLNVQSNEYPPNPEAIQHLFNISSNNNATMNVMYSNNPLKTIVKYIKNNKTISVVTGKPSTDNSIVHQLCRKCPHIRFITVSENNEVETMRRQDVIAASKTSAQQQVAQM